MRHDEFRRITYSKKSSTHPWILAGDFNELLHSFEKKGGCEFNYNIAHKFRSLLMNARLWIFKPMGAFSLGEMVTVLRISFMNDLIEFLSMKLLPVSFVTFEVFVPPVIASNPNMVVLKLDVKTIMRRKMFNMKLGGKKRKAIERLLRKDGVGTVMLVKMKACK